MSLGASELFLIMLVVLLLFGGKKLPETARQLGRGIAELRRSYVDIKREVTDPLNTTPTSPPKQTTLHAPPHSQPRSDTPESPQAS